MKCILCRGISGAGKSTWIERWLARPVNAGKVAVVCSADHYQMEGGVYVFRPERAAEAHRRCRKKFLSYFRQDNDAPDCDFLFADNTNCSAWELSFYVGVCEVFGVDYEIIRIEIDPHEAARRTAHGGSPGVIFAQWDRLRSERLPAHWKETVVLAEFPPPPKPLSEILW